MQIGYARVSTTDQDLSIQIAALQAAGCEVIRSEKKSGTTTEGREELETVLNFVRSGDTLLVVRIDRLARSIGDLLTIVKRLRERGASLRTTDGMIFDESPTGKLLLSILGTIAEFENAIRKERQMAGIERAKAAGKYRGRRKSNVDPEAITALAHLGAAEVARKLNVSRATIYRRAPAGTFNGPAPCTPATTFNVFTGDTLVGEGFDSMTDAQAEAVRLTQETDTAHEVRPSNE